MIAFALDEAGDPWAVFPTSNSLHGPCLCKEAYTWENILDVFQPNAGQPRGAQVELSLESPQAAGASWCPGIALDYVITVQNVGEAPPEVGPFVLLDATASAGLGFSSVVPPGSCPENYCPPLGDWWVLAVPPLEPGASHRITLTGVLTDDLTGIGQVDVSVSVREPEPDPILPDIVSGAKQAGVTVGVWESYRQGDPPLDPDPCHPYASISHLVDGQPPTITVTTDPAETLRPVVGSATDGDGCGVAQVEYRVDGGDWHAASGTLFWSADVDLPAAQTWEVEVRASDQCRVGGSIMVPFSDMISPTITLDLPPLVPPSGVQVGGTAQDLPAGGEVASVEVQVDGGLWRPVMLGAPGADGRQQWSLNWSPPTSGITYTLRARGVDVAGNVGQSSPSQVYVGERESPIAVGGTTLAGGVPQIPEHRAALLVTVLVVVLAVALAVDDRRLRNLQ